MEPKRKYIYTDRKVITLTSECYNNNNNQDSGTIISKEHLYAEQQFYQFADSRIMCNYSGCNKKYKSLACLKKHLEKIHKISSAAVTNSDNNNNNVSLTSNEDASKYLQCCSKDFKHSLEFKIHMASHASINLPSTPEEVLLTNNDPLLSSTLFDQYRNLLLANSSPEIEKSHLQFKF